MFGIFRKKEIVKTVSWRVPYGDAVVPGGGLDQLVNWQPFVDNKMTAILGFESDGYNQDITAPVFLDIAKAPHVLVAGACGSGKSVCMNTVLNSLLIKNSPADLELVIIDPKMSDYIEYRSLPHVRYADNSEDALRLLEYVKAEMDRRNAERQRNGWKNSPEGTKQIIVLFDEFAAFMDKQNKKVMLPILQNLACVGRAANIHLILATQYPTSQIVDSQLKSNCNTKICFKLQNGQQSRTVLDTKGAEMLFGCGDGLLLDNRTNLYRFQGAWSSDEQTEAIINWWTDPRNRIA